MVINAQTPQTSPRAPTPAKRGNELNNSKKAYISKGFSRGVRALFVLLALHIFTAPAQARVMETDESYYGRQMQSCLYKKERTRIWDLFRATRPVYMDDCCAQSVYAMQKAGARRIAAEDDCPEGSIKSRLQCETSKHWCVRNGDTAAPAQNPE